MSLQGMSLGGASLTGVRVEQGELVATRNGATVRGTALVGTQLVAQAQSLTVTPPQTVAVEYRITAVQSELAQYDPTNTGRTFLYTIEQLDDTGVWRAACPADSDGRRVAIPIAATWNASGNRVESSTMFTFGCTTGVIAKCYRWGYRPWVTGYGNLVAMHQTCTRMARADYCGDGTSHTREGTMINMWDRLPAPGPIQSHGLLPPLGMLFEAAWDTEGAVCLSHSRWLLDTTYLLGAQCSDRLVPPGLFGSVCDTLGQALALNGDALMFNEAYLNLGLGILGL